MRLETFFEKFETLAEMPGAVGKLRELVLEFAATGRLLPREQDWDFRPLKDLAIKIGSGSTPAGGRESYHETGVPLIRSMNVHFRGFDPTGLVFLSEEQAKQLANVIVQANDVLLNITGASIGRVTTAPPDMAGARVNQHVTIIRSNPSLLPRFLANYLASPSIQRMIDSIQVGATRQALTKAMIEQFEIPVPPIAEQEKIVAKINELMALCDHLEAQQQERETRHTALARAALARFAAAPTPANLRFLFHPTYKITSADLRKAILGLAVQGKLVRQNFCDESASHLVSRIRGMRRALKAVEFERVSIDEAPYELPSSWMWVRLGNIALTSDAGWSPQCLPESRNGEDWGVLKISAVSWGSYRPEENKALPPGMPGRPDCEVQPGDFLLSRANTEELVARSVVVDSTPRRLMMSDKIVRFRFPDEVVGEYINLANLSDYSRNHYARNASATSSSTKNIGRDVMCNLPIPLPPIAEQRRIVDAAKYLFGLVDKLDLKIEKAGVKSDATLGSLIVGITESA